MKPMTTVSEVLDKLQKEGYNVDFNIKDNCLVCKSNSLEINSDDFVVDRHFRFEGFSDPGDEAVVYAISSIKHNVKGTLVNGYGIYSDVIVDDLLRALNTNVLISDDNNESFKVSKYNEPTPLRPEGGRPLDSSMVIMDLPAFISQIKNEPTWKTSDRNAITIFKTNGFIIVLIALHSDAEMKTHVVPGIISIQVIEGNIKVRTEELASNLETGKMLALHANIPHSVYANEESVFLLTLTTN